MRYNPFESQYLSEEEKLQAALDKVRQLAETAGVGFTQSPLPAEQDPEGWFSPINMVLQTVDPATAESLMAVLIDGNPPGRKAQFYRDAVEQLEQDELGFDDYSMDDGTVPEDWLKAREMELMLGRRPITTHQRPLDIVFDKQTGYWDEEEGKTYGEVAEDLGITPDSMIHDLNWGRRRKQRPEF